MTDYAHGGPFWVEILDQFTVERDGETHVIPATWPYVVDEDAREAFGVGAIVEPAEDAPPGQVFTGWLRDDNGLRVLEDVDGQPVAIRAYAPPPLPEKVPMYKVKKFMALRKHQTGGAEDLHAQVIAHLEALAEPARTLALIDFGPSADQIGSPDLVVNSPLALGAKAALALSDEDYGALVRAANALA